MLRLARIPHPRASLFPRTQIRSVTMSAKHEFLIIIPDKPGTKSLRLQVRPQHLSDMKARLPGDFKEGGGLLKSLPESDDAATWDFHGTTFVMLAHSKEEVLERMADDIYAKAGVWDLEKAQVYPFKCAFRYSS